MKIDLDRTFGEIFNNDFTAFQQQLLQIQQFRNDRKESEKWVETLRFLDIKHVPDLQDIGEERPRQRRRGPDGAGSDEVTASINSPPLVIPLIQRKLGAEPYVAVSWKWTDEPDPPPPDGCTAKKSFHYLVKRKGKEAHENAFPDMYMERVINFAQSVGITNIWIDRESIFQRLEDKKHDKDLGVQIMDVVYGVSNVSVAITTTSLVHQHQIDTLYALVTRDIFVDPDDEEHPKLHPNTRRLKVQKLILRLLNDERWSRGWIFQEDHLASDRMVLLIPHAEHLKKHRCFGAIPGDLKVNLAQFRQSVTLFSMAISREHPWAVPSIIRRAKQYNIWNRKVYKNEPDSQLDWTPRYWSDFSPRRDHGAWITNPSRTYKNLSLYPTTTLSILEDICSRDLRNEQDRIALMANAAKFSVRLDISEDSPIVKDDSYSLSTALLALILLNGEILVNELKIGSKSILQHSLQSYLREYQYRFNAPKLKMEQSFIDHCRIKPQMIKKEGYQTKGFLFRLFPRDSLPQNNIVRLTERDREDLDWLWDRSRGNFFPRRQKLDAIGRQIIEILVNKLRATYGEECELADYLHEHLELDKHPPPPPERKPSTPYVIDMLSALVQALLDDRELRLARLFDEDWTASPSAIFIASVQEDAWRSQQYDNDSISRSPCVFTSWDNGRRGRSMERLASLEVGIFDKHGARLSSDDGCNSWSKSSMTVLRSYSWVNGVWLAKGKTMGSYIFPLPGFTDIEA